MDKRLPFKPFDLFDKPDYTTNAESYYDELAKNKKLLKMLIQKIWDYDKELAKRFEEWDKNLEDFPEDVKKLLIKWLEEGTLTDILTDAFLTMKSNVVTSVTEPIKHNDQTYWFHIVD